MLIDNSTSFPCFSKVNNHVSSNHKSLFKGDMWHVTRTNSSFLFAENHLKNQIPYTSFTCDARLSEKLWQRDSTGTKTNTEITNNLLMNRKPKPATIWSRKFSLLTCLKRTAIIITRWMVTTSNKTLFGNNNREYRAMLPCVRWHSFCAQWIKMEDNERHTADSPQWLW